MPKIDNKGPWRRGEAMTAQRLNAVTVDEIIRVLQGGRGINVERIGQGKIVISATGGGAGGTGSNGTWVSSSA